MSAFFFALNRDGEPFSPTVAEKMLGQLKRYGVDGSELVVRENFAIGHQRHWTVPEEQGETQPLQDKQAGLWLVFHGRIDNREQLISRLDREQLNSLQSAKRNEISDAQLLLALYRQFGQTIFAQIIGPFVFVIFAEKTGNVIAARDPMGGRYLVHRVTPEQVLLATYEMALVAHPGVSYELNKIKAGRLLVNMMDSEPASLLADLTPLPAGSMLECSRQHSATVTTYYLPDPEQKVVLQNDVEYAGEFRRLLMQAVGRRMRSIKPVGVMLSGGLDSVPLAICATTFAAQQGRRLNAFSWVFDLYPDADERRYSQPVCDQFNIKPHWVNCDKVWPQFDSTMHCNPVVPFSTPYSAFTQALFANAEDSGNGVMLSGMGGDMLYSGIETLLLELIRSGRWQNGFHEAQLIARAMPSVRSFAKRFLINPLLRRSVKHSAPPWLKTEDTGLNINQSHLKKQIECSHRPQQYFNVVGSLEGEDAAYGRFLDAAYGQERRYPYRDRELAEFMLGIPADQLFYQGVSRPIVRNAFKNELPVSILNRRDKTNFSQVLSTGISRDAQYRKWLDAKNPQWAEFVEKSYILQKETLEGNDLSIQWRCAYYEYWKTVCYTSYAQKLG